MLFLIESEEPVPHAVEVYICEWCGTVIREGFSCRHGHPTQ